MKTIVKIIPNIIHTPPSTILSVLDELVCSLFVVFGFILNINYIEWIICISWIALVIGAELFNTAIETTVNIAMPNIDKSAKKAKDVSAGGVLVFAIGSFIIGIIIFLPKIVVLIGELL